MSKQNRNTPSALAHSARHLHRHPGTRCRQAGYSLVGVLVLCGLLLGSTRLTRSAQAQTELQQLATATRTPTPINVGNFIWDDVDGDGRQDAGEPGLAGIVVQLWNSTKTALIDQTTTNGNGNYTLIAPTPGAYRIRVILPGFSDQFSPKNAAGGDDQLDSDINSSGTSLGFTDIYNFPSNLISITTIDAGLRIFRTPTPTRTPTPINVGNFVWDDLDDDGTQDAGEPGMGGVVVQLWNSAKTALIDQTTTDANGRYTLIAPLPGPYRVRVVLPHVGDQFSPKNGAGGNDQLDSDINPSGTSLGFTDIYSFASNLISITTIDAGIRLAVPNTPTPAMSPTPNPSATPDVSATPGSTMTPGPTDTPAPSQTPNPTDTPDPNATPEPPATVIPDDYFAYLPVIMKE